MILKQLFGLFTEYITLNVYNTNKWKYFALKQWFVKFNVL